MCFGQAFTRFTPPSYPRGTNTAYQNAYCLAPYFRDFDPRKKGNYYFQMYDNANDDTDSAIVDRAVQLVLGVYGVNIQPDLIVTATWEDVVRYGDSASSTKVSYLHSVDIQLICKLLRCIYSASSM